MRDRIGTLHRIVKLLVYGHNFITAITTRKQQKPKKVQNGCITARNLEIPSCVIITRKVINESFTMSFVVRWALNYCSIH